MHLHLQHVPPDSSLANSVVVGPPQVRFSFDEPDFAMIDTLFSLAEAHLFMQLVELQDSRPHLLPPGKSYPGLYR